MEPNYRYLGNKTFFLFVLRRSLLFFILLLLSVILSAITFKITGDFSVIVGKVASIAFLLSLLFLLAAVLFGWIEYINYRFILDENAFRVRRGILSKEEVAIPYRQIQNVNIERSFFDQIMGLSQLIILTASHEDEDEPIKVEPEGILPSLDKNLARQIQDDLLKRASVEKVVMA